MSPIARCAARLVATGLLATGLCACEGQTTPSDGGMTRTEPEVDTGQSQPLGSISPSQWEDLSRSTIVFGHQSVGWNILEGVESVMAGKPEIRLNIAEIDPSQPPAGPGLLHFGAGSNGDPISKLESFSEMMSTEVGKQADVAFLKFCYVDFWADTDVEEVFDRYQKTLSALARSNPNTRFIHSTVPLTIAGPGDLIGRVKELAKSILGRPTSADHNAARNRYNRLLLATYADSAPIFDIARVESTRPDGSRCYTTRKGEKVFSLAEELTTDGGHLNDLGKQRAAERLLVLLAEIAGGER